MNESIVFFVLETFYSGYSLDRQCSFLHSLMHFSNFVRTCATPLALCPAVQIVEDFFVNFSVLLIFGVYKNQLSLVVIISNNISTGSSTRSCFHKPLGPRFPAFFLGRSSSSSSSSPSSSCDSILSLPLPSLSVSEDLKHAIN